MDKKLITGLFTIVMIFTCAALGTLAFVPESELVTGFRDFFGVFLMSANAVTVSAATAILIILAVGAMAGIWYGLTFSADRFHVVKTNQANALKAQADALKAYNEAQMAGYKFDTAPAGSQGWITKLVGSPLVTDPAHLSPGRINGMQTHYEAAEEKRWKIHQELYSPTSRAQIAAPGNPLALPEAIEPELDLLTVFTQSTQSYAVIGGQQVGKTFQMRHVAAYWLRNGIQPVVIGPKWDKHEWDGCLKLGGSGDFSEVAKGIAIIRQEVEKRHADTELGHKDHGPLPVFFDDWTPIVDAVENARALVLEATTLYASVNVLLYFILHSDTANAWGVDRKGAALKENFIKLIIVPHYDIQGLIARDKTRGYIKFSGDGNTRPVRLFTAPVVPVYGDMSRLDITPSRDWLEPSILVDEEISPAPAIDPARVLELFDSGEHKTPTAICNRLLGYKNGKVLEQIKAILVDNNRIG